VSWVRAVVVVLAGLAVTELVIFVQVAIADPYFAPGMDYEFYRAVGERWLADGSYYLPHQLAGPHDVALMVDVLYPPSALFLFVPFVWLPAVLWWAVPIGVIGYALYRWRPSPLGWLAILLLLMWPGSMSVLVYGNTNLWVAAAVAGGLLWGWPAVLLVLKPSLLPLALVGVRHRSFWVAAVVMGAFALLTLPLHLDYLTITRDVRGVGLSYVLWGLPIVAVPLVAWWSRRFR
jgi:hypothetical protein